MDARPTAPKPVQARSLRTRAKLLDATVDALVELGYAGASTTAIAKRAGVSQGALYKHFPTKPQLLEAALAHLFAQLIADFDRGFAADESVLSDPIAAAFRHLWEVFASAKLQAAFELYLAARTDGQLADAIAPVLGQHRLNIESRARALFPALADTHDDFEGVVQALMNTMQGAALASSVMPIDAEATHNQRAAIERMARRELTRLLAQA